MGLPEDIVVVFVADVRPHRGVVLPSPLYLSLAPYAVSAAAYSGPRRLQAQAFSRAFLVFGRLAPIGMPPRLAACGLASWLLLLSVSHSRMRRHAGLTEQFAMTRERMLVESSINVWRQPVPDIVKFATFAFLATSLAVVGKEGGPRRSNN